MPKRSSVLAVAALTLPMAAVLVAGPASAQEVQREAGERRSAPPADRPCGSNYTNGQRYELSNNPRPVPGAGRQGQTAVRVARGAEVRMSSRLQSVPANGPSRPCPGQRVTILAGSANSAFRAVNSNRTTDATGTVYGSRRANSDFRFFSRYTSGRTIAAQTPTTLVQVR